jgi:arylsulfatase
MRNARRPVGGALHHDARMRGALVIILLAASLVSCGRTRSEPEGSLNVLMLVIDDARWDTVGAAGNPVVQTPRLDRLAAEGVRFEQAFVTTSICMTSRASIFTGQYMSRHGITTFGEPIAEEPWADTYPGVLSAAGYWQGFVGKYGVGDAREEDFDFLRAYERHHWFEEPDGERVHVTEKNARDALEFLRARPADRPFALSVSFFAAHAEDAAPEQFLPQAWSAAAYEGVSMPPPLRSDPAYFEALPPFLRQPSNEGRVRYHWRFDTPERYVDYLTRYYRLITEVDEVVGRLLDELEAQGVADRTLVIYIGDNGYFQADRGLADKWYPYEESIRVPLIVRDPRLPSSARGRVEEAVALNLDVAPTILAAAGLSVPGSMQGRDLADVYLREADDWRDEFFYEHPTITSRDRIPSSEAVVGRDWKFVYWPEFEFEQLFDLRSDPGEKVNLAVDPAHADRLPEWRGRLDTWRERARQKP